MKTDPTPISAADARRLLLAGAHLLRDPARPLPTIDVVRALGFLQLDSINVVERAHELILHARSDAYEREAVFRDLRGRRLFEHWTHDASLIPAEHYPHWHHRFARFRARWQLDRLGAGAAALAEQVVAGIRQEGPLMSRDFDDPHDHRRGGWWDWKPAKAVLEHLWRTGTLAVGDRRGFQKVYDLAERAIRFHTAPPTQRDALVDWACGTALDRLGVATPAELAAFYRVVDVADARAWVRSRLQAGSVMPVEVEGRISIAYSDVRRRLGRLGEPLQGHVRFLAPFDPLVRDRARAERLFGFRYRFEAFVPEAKRVHGYYVLPVLVGDRLVGRADAKLDRAAGVLRLRVMPWERGFSVTPAFRVAFGAAADRLRQFIGAARVDVTGRSGSRHPFLPPTR
ncbi:MAG TPA: crosslink repair DNA glycosylase YcaQ family protein [Tepidisphaeraceae bacterium]|nr:crosslink repair DNA glycosylase YcaQ family protein [Tepidisphaeraceae bacterium]